MAAAVTPDHRVRPQAVAWAAALVPFAAAHVAYLISAAAGIVPWCLPYLEGCTSISRAARSGLANPVFRGMMLPCAVILMLYWWLVAEWLRALAPARAQLRLVTLGLGLTGALFLILYATFLGVEGDTYRWMRRYGVTVHFSFTVLAQILLTWALAGEARVSAAVRRGKLALCAAMLALGLASIPLQHFVEDRGAALNAVEWSYSLLMVAFFPLTAAAWSATRFSIRLRLDP